LVLDRSRRPSPALWLAIQRSIGGALCWLLQPRAGLGLDDQEEGREPFINPRSVAHLPCSFPPSVPDSPSSPANQKNLHCPPFYTHKMAPYAPTHVQLLPSWDNGPYSPVLDVDDRFPTIEPSDDQYPGPYLSNVLPPLSAATSLIRSPSHRHSWSHSSDGQQSCCDSGTPADSPHYRQIQYTDGDYVYSPDGYLPSQHTPNDQVSPPRPRFGQSG
jgi:hypothetical protein